MPHRFFLLIVFISFLSAACNSQTKLIAFNDPRIYYEGRISKKPDGAELSWSGTSVTVFFTGTNISAILKDTDTANYYNVIIDDKEIHKIHTDTAKRNYPLAAGLDKGKHKVQLFKRTEWDKGKTMFYGFATTPETNLLPLPAPKKRKIEFYGNSITCGYAAEDYSGNDVGNGYFENNYLSYAAITARYFDAQYYCIAKSGIGVMVSWFPLIMPEMYDRLDASDSSSKWDFSKYTPDVVVINLFQNDCWIVKIPDNDQFKHRFGNKAPDDQFIINAYKNFVSSIRTKYPNADILCLLGNMDGTAKGSPWPGYIDSAAAQLHDSRIYTHFFAYKNTGGHPKVEEQKAMADDLIQFIKDKIKW